MKSLKLKSEVSDMSNKSPFTTAGMASLCFALIALSGCGHSDPPAKAPPPQAAAAANNHAPKELSDANSPALGEATQGDASVKPEQIPIVGMAPPGGVAFGPALPDMGMDPAGDAERAAYLAIRQKQLDAKQKLQQAAAQHATPTPAHPAPAATPTKHQ
jgi:hypothetical protein